MTAHPGAAPLSGLTHGLEGDATFEGIPQYGLLESESFTSAARSEKLG